MFMDLLAMRVLARLLTVFLVSLFMTGAALAAEAPDELVRRISDEVIEIARTDPGVKKGQLANAVAQIDARVLPHFDFQHMTALALGKEWRKASPAQRQQLTHEFKALLVRTYANALTSYRDQKVVFKSFKMAPGETEVLVRTEVVQPGGKNVSIDYSLDLNEGSWKVFDVVVAGISLVTNYREQFATEVRAGGIDGLIQTLVSKNKSV